MNKKILIFLVFVTAIFSLCAVIVSASECGHNNISSERVFTYDAGGYCYIYNETCPDCGHSYSRQVEHVDIGGECLECGVSLNDACEHIYENGICRECGHSCLHFFKDGNCETCGLPCPHSLGYENGICRECGWNCEHIYENGICNICGSECAHNWVEYDRKHTHNRIGDCYTSFTRCEYCNEEWSNGFGHNVNEYNVCVECDIYMNCLHEWLEEGVCTECGWKCEHIYDGWGICHTCGLRCQHTNRLTHTGDNSMPSVNSFCWFTYEKCLDCNYEIQHLYYSHTFDNGKCVDCGISLEGVTCEHNSLNITDEGFTHNQNSYCYRIIEKCTDCHYTTYRDISHEFYKGKCKACELVFVSGLEQDIYEDAYSQGKDDGYNQGYTDGTQDGYENGYEDGELEWYDIGYSDGYNIGVKDGYEGDYELVYNQGYTDGTQDGYENGYNTATDEFEKKGFGNLFYNIFDAEVGIFKDLLSFEIFGINIASFIISLMSIMIIAFIFKKVF